MTYQCDGISYCEIGEKAVAIIKAKNFEEKIEILGSPLCIKKEEFTEPAPDKTCFRFWGTSNEIITFEHYVCAYSAEYQTDPSLINNGAWLVADGKIQNGTGYYYFSGTFGSTTYARYLEVATEIIRQGVSSGDCICTRTEYKLSIFNKDGIKMYEKINDELMTEKVNCNGCPPGHIKCKSNHYPGYCCVPCKPTADRINNLVSRIK